MPTTQKDTAPFYVDHDDDDEPRVYSLRDPNWQSPWQFPNPADARAYADMLNREFVQAVGATAKGEHDCNMHAVYIHTDGPIGHGWECGVCGDFLQAG